jgi:hypothetical protein
VERQGDRKIERERKDRTIERYTVDRKREETKSDKNI